MASGRRVSGDIRSVVNDKVLHESLFVPILMSGSSETMIWKGKKSRIRAVKMDNLRGLRDIRRMDKVRMHG